MELRKTFLVICSFLFCSCFYSQTINSSIDNLVKNDKDIEKLYKQLKKVMNNSDKNEIINSSFEFKDQEWNHYETMYDMIHKTNIIYRIITFNNKIKKNSIQIKFYKTDNIDTKIEIWHTSRIQMKVKYKMIEGIYDVKLKQYKFNKLTVFN